MARIALFVKKQIRLDRLNFRQKGMFTLGTVASSSVVNRVSSGKNGNDGPAKPLTKRYAIRKSRLSKQFGGRGRNRRDLTLSGAMLREFKVRSVSENKAFASNSTRLGRIKAAANERIERWVVFSKTNIRDVREAGKRLLVEMKPRLIIERALGRR